jgi:hypothetical protein
MYRGIANCLRIELERLRSARGLCRVEVLFGASGRACGPAKPNYCLALLLFFSAQCIIGALAQEQSGPTASPTPGTSSTELSPIVVIGRENSLIGIAGSASEGTVGQEKFRSVRFCALAK